MCYPCQIWTCGHQGRQIEEPEEGDIYFSLVRALQVHLLSPLLFHHPIIFGIHPIRPPLPVPTLFRAHEPTPGLFIRLPASRLLVHEIPTDGGGRLNVPPRRLDSKPNRKWNTASNNRGLVKHLKFHILISHFYILQFHHLYKCFNIWFYW